MFRELATRILNVHRILVLSLSLSAASGWVSFAASSQSAIKLEGQLQREVASLQDAQAKLLSEQARTRASLSEMGQLRADLAAARTDLARVSQPMDRAKPVLPPVRPGAKDSLRTSGISDAVSKTESIAVKSGKSPPVKAASGDKPQPQSRNGQVAAVKTTTPSGHGAIERSQRGTAPAITPELDAASLRRLTNSAEAQAQ
jgi:hypothetical protein